MLDESIFLLLTSPPASGKTFWIKSYAKNFRVGEFLVLSPLRALVDECRLNWGNDIQVMTPEEYLCKNISPKVVIIDEFHLWYFWGNSFRPLMWEGLFKVLAQAHICICLSATVSEKMLEEKAGPK
jgi:superfamily II DNA helicase RecQ